MILKESRQTIIPIEKEPLKSRNSKLGIRCKNNWCMNTNKFVIRERLKHRYCNGEVSLDVQDARRHEQFYRYYFPLVIQAQTIDRPLYNELPEIVGPGTFIPETVQKKSFDIRCAQCGGEVIAYAPQVCSCAAGCDSCARISNRNLFVQDCLDCISKVSGCVIDEDFCSCCPKGQLRRENFSIQWLKSFK